MSVSNIIDSTTGRIADKFLPSSDVHNPLTSNLDCNNYGIINASQLSLVNDSTTISISVDNVDVPDSLSITGGPLKMNGQDIFDVNELEIKNSISISEGSNEGYASLTFDSDTYTLISNSNLSLTNNAANSLNCGQINCEGIEATSIISTTADINCAGLTATGTIVPSQWNSYPQCPVGNPIIWNAGNSSVDLINQTVPAGLYMINFDAEIVKNGQSTPGAYISLQYILSNGYIGIVTSRQESIWVSPGTGNALSCFSFIVIQPNNGSLTLQLDGGSFSSGEEYYSIIPASLGFIRLR